MVKKAAFTNVNSERKYIELALCLVFKDWRANENLNLQTIIGCHKELPVPRPANDTGQRRLAAFAHYIYCFKKQAFDSNCLSNIYCFVNLSV